MSIVDVLLRVLRLPKLFIAIVKRCSIATFRWLRYLLSFWNAPTERRQGRHFLKDDADDALTPVTLIAGSEEPDSTVKCVTIQCSKVCGSAVDYAQAIVPTPTSSSAGSQSFPGDHSDTEKFKSPFIESTTPVCTTYWCSSAGSRRLESVSCKPPLRKPLFTTKTLFDLLCMLCFLDHPNIIGRCIESTQVRACRATKVVDWKAFWCKFRNDIKNTNLLATVLLAANIGFLAIPSIDQQGLTYWPERLCYMSLLCSLGSIVMGIAVRTPRFFTSYSPFYFKVMVFILDVPFEFFYYGLLFFTAAVVVHVGKNAAVTQSRSMVNGILARKVGTVRIRWLKNPRMEWSISTGLIPWNAACPENSYALLCWTNCIKDTNTWLIATSIIVNFCERIALRSLRGTRFNLE